MTNIIFKWFFISLIALSVIFSYSIECLADSNSRNYWHSVGLKPIIDLETDKLEKFTAKIINNKKLEELGLRGAPEGALVEVTNLGQGKWHIKLLQLGNPIDKEIIIENAQLKDE